VQNAVRAGQVAPLDAAAARGAPGASEIDRAVVARELQNKRKTDALAASGSQPGSSQPQMSPPGSSQPHMSPPGSSQPHMSPPGSSQPHMSPPGSSQPYASQPYRASQAGPPGPSQGDVIEIEDDEAADNVAGGAPEDLPELYCQMRASVVGIQYYKGACACAAAAAAAV
jgi:hypothetical protein